MELLINVVHITFTILFKGLCNTLATLKSSTKYVVVLSFDEYDRDELTNNHTKMPEGAMGQPC